MLVVSYVHWQSSASTSPVLSDYSLSPASGVSTFSYHFEPEELGDSHMGSRVEGNEKADGLARRGGTSLFSVPEPALEIPPSHTNAVIANWTLWSFRVGDQIGLIVDRPSFLRKGLPVPKQTYYLEWVAAELALFFPRSLCVSFDHDEKAPIPRHCITQTWRYSSNSNERSFCRLRQISIS